MTPPVTNSPTLNAVSIAELVNRRELCPTDVVETALRRIATVDTELRAFREVWSDRARRTAYELKGVVDAGFHLPLAGVPLAVKASEGLTSPQARRLLEAGCIPIGTTSVPRGTSWQTWGHTDRGPTINPWRADRSPGGSSAGSAAAVAAGLVPLATGNDGAGSVRIPAAWCGVVGIKTTNGCLPSVNTLNAPGPLARTVADAAAYLDAILGTNLAAHTRDPLQGAPLRAVWSTALGYAEVDPQVTAPARDAAEQLAAGGLLQWVRHDLVLEDPTPAWQARRTGSPTGHAADELHAANARRLAELFACADVLLTPTTPYQAHDHVGPGSRINVALTWAFNLSGHPAASVPAGFAPDGTPVGLQIVTRHHREDLLVRAAAALQNLKPWPSPPHALLQID
ncbi:amidase [Micromonospora lupini]|uniref:amidase n=1 Tax=Micromonospora lupini TaxID=285679 RepID=UPI00225A2C10|nr:amidase [Micromonospora lupini]MCX5070359.1 amidase [Micromonospora lupini]